MLEETLMRARCLRSLLSVRYLSSDVKRLGEEMGLVPPCLAGRVCNSSSIMLCGKPVREQET